MKLLKALTILWSNRQKELVMVY